MNERNFYYIGIAFFGMINGIFNPLFFFVFQISVYLMAAPLFESTAAIAYFASLMLSTATVILGGIPAAIYERFIGAKDDSDGHLALDLARMYRHSDTAGDREFPENRALIAFSSEETAFAKKTRRRLRPFAPDVFLPLSETTIGMARLGTRHGICSTWKFGMGIQRVESGTKRRPSWIRLSALRS